MLREKMPLDLLKFGAVNLVGTGEKSNNKVDSLELQTTIRRSARSDQTEMK